jgi:hypothetical protein
VKSETITPEEMLQILGHTEESAKTILGNVKTKAETLDDSGGVSG